MKKILLFLFLLTNVLIYSQTAKAKMEEAFRELEEGKLTLVFLDALNGKPIDNAKVTIFKVGKYITNYKGEIYFPIPEEEGNYHLKFFKKGYITSDFEIEIMTGTLIFNRFSISPKMPMEYVRIVLDWGKMPKDIDAHLVKKDNYHISYRNMTVSDEAKLDRDDTDSYGPETITIKNIVENKIYFYFVHNYSDRSHKSSSSLSKSGVCVSVFGEGDKLLKRFIIPQNKKGVYWSVFQIKNGEIITINEVLKNMDF